MSQASNASSQPERHRRYQPRHPPSRLSWPISVGESKRDDGADQKTTSRKRPRVSFSNVVDADEGCSKLWVDKHAPSSSSELCVAPKKVKETKSWILDAMKRASSKKLLILVGSPGIGKSTMVEVLSKEIGVSIHRWTESYVPLSGQRRGDLVSIESSSALQTFEQFLHRCGAGFSTLSMTNGEIEEEAKGGSIILLDELPNLHNFDAEIEFRRIISDHLRRSRSPTVLIFSDVSEGKHKPDDLEKLVDHDVLYDQPSVSICQIHPVTKPKMKKVLNAIAQKEKRKIPASFFEELHLQSGGDLRHAIMKLQLQSAGGASTTKINSASDSERDVKLTTFHSLGKLLYGKRINLNGRSTLAFDPETILERSDLGVGGSLRFLECHSVDFFSDIEELSNAFGLFSDATTLLDFPLQGNRSHANFPDGCASSIAGRAVANTNTKPTPNKFRQFATPNVFDMIRKRKQNDVLLSHLQRRVSSRQQSVFNAVMSPGSFVTDMLPSMQIILPNDVNPSLGNLYSMAGETIAKDATNQSARKRSEAARMEEQAKILEVDDIVDADSGDEKKIPSATQAQRRDPDQNDKKDKQATRPSLGASQKNLWVKGGTKPGTGTVPRPPSSVGSQNSRSLPPNKDIIVIDD